MHNVSKFVFLLSVLIACLSRTEACTRRPTPVDEPEVKPRTCNVKCGTCGDSIDVTLMIRNEYKPPFFEYETIVQDYPSRELVHFLQEAAKQDAHFQFTANFHTLYGFMVTSINSLAANGDEKTYWNIIEADSGNATSTGISSYLPEHGKTVLFNFTTWASH